MEHMPSHSTISQSCFMIQNKVKNNFEDAYRRRHSEFTIANYPENAQVHSLIP